MATESVHASCSPARSSSVRPSYSAHKKVTLVRYSSVPDSQSNERLLSAGPRGGRGVLDRHSAFSA